MPAEYNKSHIQGILKKNGKNLTLHNFVLFLWRSHFKNSCFGFHQVSSIALHLLVNALMLDLSSSIFVLISRLILDHHDHRDHLDYLDHLNHRDHHDHLDHHDHHLDHCDYRDPNRSYCTQSRSAVKAKNLQLVRCNSASHKYGPKA